MKLTKNGAESRISWPDSSRVYLRNEIMEKILKRVFDIICSMTVIVLIFPCLIPVVGLLIRLNSKGGIFFVQKRNGLHNKVFGCIKFRTMIINDKADSLAAVENDQRITKVGKLLRISGIDELPQLINVLFGEMSLVGPRPHMLSDNIRFEKMAENYRRRTLVKPGITGLAQVKGYRGGINDVQCIKIRTALDLKYIEHYSLLMDCKIITATAKLIFVEIFRKRKTTGLSLDHSRSAE